MVDKSQLLDELRLAVGSVPDYARTLTDFYNGIVHKLVSNMNNQFSVCLYETKVDRFIQVAFAGLSPCEEVIISFGEGLHSIAAIRGGMVFKVEGEMQLIIAPFYYGHHLIGVLSFQIPVANYEISEDDLVFIKEVTRFIESNYKYYK
ncbi:hypothetical protein RYX56_12985 [Alkalihalophilus lindianensis]|uniref:GAF domain-containing protein n=1 Tax=Alkalihalophilus lindianensis TaxID=1630542 RepID=A0ABU3XBK9_9BACI|nr:hypothetical protein [Alkalihalophilus lindianensis]MDV2685271.1 hypothetical protein [Alkalihalophilus lindianensis]